MLVVSDLGPVILSQPHLPQLVVVKTKEETEPCTTLSSIEEEWYKM